MKFTFISTLLLLFIIISGCKKETPIPDELLKDNGFENIQSGNWWVFNDTTGFNLRLSSSGYSTSGHSAAAARTVRDSVNISGFSQQYTGEIPVGETLVLSCWIKGENLAGKGVALVINCNGDQPNLQIASSEDDVIINGTFDWQQFTVSLPNVSGQVKSISIFLVYLTSTTGKVYFDDVSLKHN